MNIEERREKVKEFYEAGVFAKTMAEKLGVSKKTITSDLKYLREHHAITIKLSIEDRRQIAVKLYERDVKIKAIAQVLETAYPTIQIEIKSIKEDEEKKNSILEETKEEKIEKDLLSYQEKYENGILGQEEILLLKKNVLISGNLKWVLFYIEVCKQFEKYEEALAFVRFQIENEKLSKEDKQEIIEKLSVFPLEKVEAIQRELEEDIQDEEREITYETLEERNKIVENLFFEKGKKEEKIAKILDIPLATVARIINQLKVKKGEGVKEDGRNKEIGKYEEYLNQYKERYKKNTLRVEDIEKIKTIVTLTAKLEDKLFYIRVCLKLGKDKKALEYIQKQLQRQDAIQEDEEKEESLEKEREIFEKVKEQIEIKRETRLVINLLKAGEEIREIADFSGLSEERIREIQQKLNKVESKEEKEESEELQK